MIPIKGILAYDDTTAPPAMMLELTISKCKCEIPAHNYAFSFAPNSEWPNYYATSEQIQSYMHDVSELYGCDQYIKYKQSIKRAAWDESKGKWNIEVQDGNQNMILEEADVFVNDGGVLK